MTKETTSGIYPARCLICMGDFTWFSGAPQVCVPCREQQEKELESVSDEEIEKTPTAVLEEMRTLMKENDQLRENVTFWMEESFKWQARSKAERKELAEMKEWIGKRDGNPHE